jgi:hypothetical protein
MHDEASLNWVVIYQWSVFVHYLFSMNLCEIIGDMVVVFCWERDDG